MIFIKFKSIIEYWTLDIGNYILDIIPDLLVLSSYLLDAT